MAKTTTLVKKSLLMQKMDNPEAAIYFVSGGTQSNLLVIASYYNFMRR